MNARRELLCALAGALLLAGCTAAPKGDPVRGMEVHKVCLDCHGTELYTSPKRKIASLDALRKDVVRWGDYYAPALSEQDVDDITAYLNRDFYKF
jgi:mono/diheme cytochrome c family protein